MKKSGLPFFLSENDPPAKRSILMTALELFATRGVDGVTIRDIAAKTGFSNPAMFRHFKTKEELARSLFESCYRRLAYAFRDPEGGLAGALGRGLELIEDSPESVHFVLENLRRYWRELPADLRVNSVIGSMRRLIEIEQKAGRVRDGLDPQLAAAIVIGTLAQIARMAHFDELRKPPSQLASDLFNLLDQGLGA